MNCNDQNKGEEYTLSENSNRTNDQRKGAGRIQGGGAMVLVAPPCWLHGVL